MGLDMSIKIKRKPLRGRTASTEILVLRTYFKGRKEIDYDIPDIKTGKIKYNQTKIKNSTRVEDTYELAYWRKANAIHNWFIINVKNGQDDCKEHRLTEEDLQNLLVTVNDVLDHCELKDGIIRNGYTIKRFLWKTYRKYNKEKGKVLTKQSIKYCSEKLPTQEGFFFGNTDYDEYYYEMLVYTKEKLEYILSHYNLKKDKIYYSSSW